MKYTVNIKSKNQMFLVNGRNIRSPFISVVDDSVLKIIKSKIKYYGLQEHKDYEIEAVEPSSNIPDYSKLISKPKGQPLIQKIDKPIEEIKYTVTIPEQVKPTKVKVPDAIVQKVLPKTFIKPQNLCSDFHVKTEQNIKNSTVDTEVRIEELSTKSTSILEKILAGEF
jgi:hypothetical protein